jgi:hypothetical protein
VNGRTGPARPGILARLSVPATLFSLLTASFLALGLLQSFQGCAGGGTETEYDMVSGRLVTADNRPVEGALVEARPADYLTDILLSERKDSAIQNAYTNRQGDYLIRGLPPGRYRFAFSTALDTFGRVRDTVVNMSRIAIDLGKEVLLPLGSISGAILPDSDSQASGFVQVFGVQKIGKVVDQGRFTIPLPQGVYDIRLTSEGPFRREKILYGIRVTAGEETKLDPVALEKEAKLEYSLDAIGLKILGLDSTNPVIFDNERWDNSPDDEYIWAKASAGSLNLRGTIVTRDFHLGLAQEEQLRKGRLELREARMAGFANLPELTPGASSMLAWPSSGNLEDITPIRSAGSDLIVAEAKKATPEKPLLVVVGGPLTTVAQAWLTDTSIATRMIVAGVFTYKLHPDDTVANYLVARKCRYLQWGRQYVWSGKPDTSLIRSIPPTLMGDRLRTYLGNNAKLMSFGDLAPVGFLFRRSVWQGADIVKVSRSLDVKPASDISFDFVDIPEAANDFNGFQAEFYAAMTDPRAYHPAVLPGELEAESYLASSKTAVQAVDSATGNATIAYSDGGYTEHKISAAGGSFQAKIRYRSTGGAKLALAWDGEASPAGIQLPGVADWAEAELPALTLEAGEHTLRVAISGGTASLDWIAIRLP